MTGGSMHFLRIDTSNQNAVYINRMVVFRHSNPFSCPCNLEFCESKQLWIFRKLYCIKRKCVFADKESECCQEILNGACTQSISILLVNGTICTLHRLVRIVPKTINAKKIHFHADCFHCGIDCVIHYAGLKCFMLSSIQFDWFHPKIIAEKNSWNRLKLKWEMQPWFLIFHALRISQVCFRI
jgi:hypothetical protein